ncbi:MAG: CZB domain-containing protein [Burkholderiaceae bacterium]|nr:CZB domain-containing protein [Sulfuritalea sp.]MCF8176549.1 CZB domain-containing protein [Burkholderiaceae bacterium]
MGIMDWFKNIVQGGGTPDLAAPGAATEKSAELAGLNFKTAIDAHMKWKVRLESYINGTSTEDLKVEVICRDDQCPLGKWIYDTGGEQFGYSETFSEVKAHHAHFHRCAGAVLETAQRGETDAALKLLRGGDYVKTSERVKMLLARMFMIASEGRAAVDTHIKWKSRLQACIKGESAETLTVDTASRDDQCTVGQWIHGIGGARFGDLPAFLTVKARHADFHRCAGDVLAHAERGEQAQALHMLENGPFAEASDRVVEAIVVLFERIKPAT